MRQGRLYLLDSGRGRLVGVDTGRGTLSEVIQLDGFPRGLAIVDRFAFVGLSKIRETATFGAIPLAARRERLQCGVAAVDLQTGRQIAWLRFHSGIDEIFDVQFIAGVRRPALSGPYPDVDGQPALWLAPESARSGSDTL